MAQRNRRRARSGGSPNRKSGTPGNAPTPGPYESGEEQLTEAQLAFGRPELAETPNATELEAFEQADAEHDRATAPAAGPLSTRAGSGRAREASGTAVAERTQKVGLFGQLTGFLQGSWRELQRVQWPDRRQVFQATGVVLGFVIVAGAFLGVASFAAQKIVNLILYGHG